MPDFRYKASDYWDEHDFSKYDDVRKNSFSILPLIGSKYFR